MPVVRCVIARLLYRAADVELPERYAMPQTDDRSEEFVREAFPHGEYLLRRAWYLTRQRVDAEDLVQDTMLKAYVSYGKFRKGSNLRSWLCQIMVNTWVDRYRAAQRRPSEKLSADITDAMFGNVPAGMHGGPPSAEAEAMAALPGKAHRALRTLPADLRLTIYYADIEGYRNTEIAELLDIPVGTVASRLHRGRSRLRDLLIGAH
ncbi:MAG: sigma-70 family RNA polymerase sigma factor [Mycobacterium sp.]